MNKKWGKGDMHEEDWQQSGNGCGPIRYSNLITHKDEWAGTSPERAFSEDVPWSFKRQAQIKYYAMLEQGRKALVAHTSCEMASNGKWRVEPQISAFYSSFPWPARASIGHTIFSEASYLRDTITENIRQHLCVPELAEGLALDVNAYTRAAYLTAQSLGNRALFDALGQIPELANVEFYRLFQAAHSTLRFPRLSDVINGAILVGDILPDSRFLKLHPVTEQILVGLSIVSQEFWKETSSFKDGSAITLYLNWGTALMQVLCRYLPPKREKEQAADEKGPGSSSRPESKGTQEGLAYLANQNDMQNMPDILPPLSEPQPPLLDEPTPSSYDPLRNILNSLAQRSGLSDEQSDLEKKISPTKTALDELMNTARSATSQTRQWEDIREDLVEQQLNNQPFQLGPIQGEITHSNSITREIGGREVGGELFDRSVPLCESIEKIQQLHQQARPVADILRRNLYPSTHEEFQAEYPRASGQIDARRLPLAEFSDAVYRRFHSRQELDPTGRAVLLIASDASASLSDAQMKMCKCLLTAWLSSASSTKVQILAAFYHSGYSSGYVTGPLVQWVYHPDKTPVYTARDAVRAVASLPDTGTGSQSDAISLVYLLDEARAISRGSHVYVTLISDCLFNKSFHDSPANSEEEVVEVIKQGRKQFNEKLHVTLVALERNPSEQVKNAVDAVITVQGDELRSPDKVAEKVGIYVAKCISTRRNQMRKKGA